MTTTIVRARAGQPKDLLKTGAAAQEPNCGGDTIVRDAETGEAVAYVGRFPAELLGAYRQALRTYPRSTMLRMAGTRNEAGSFGYVARSVVFKRNGCRTCGGATANAAGAAAHATICGAAGPLFEQLERVLPERAADLERAQVIRADWRIGGPWTSGVVNFDSPLPYHYDGNNLPCWSAMPVVRRGVRGGHLHIPAYDLVVECRDGDVVFFPGYELMHGVTPLRRKGDGYRISAVYYTVAAMRHCGPPDEELDRGRRQRSERETGLLARQRGDGLLAHE